LIDKIKLPPGIATQRNYEYDDHLTKRPKKKTTTGTKLKINNYYCTQDRIDQKCNKSDQSLIVRSILFNNESQIELFSNNDNEIDCKSAQNYKKCLNLNFEKDCKKSLNKTFEKLERMNKYCLIRTRHKTTTPNNKSLRNKYSIFIIIISFIIKFS